MKIYYFGNEAKSRSKGRANDTIRKTKKEDGKRNFLKRKIKDSRESSN